MVVEVCEQGIQEKADQAFLDGIRTERERQDLTIAGRIVSLTPFVRDLGFHASRKNISSFIRALVADEIPLRIWLARIKIGPQRRILVLPEYDRRIETALDQNPTTHQLRQNPVQQLFGEVQIPIPTSYELRDTDEYVSFGKAVASRGIKVGGPLFRSFLDKLNDCPVPVFKTNGKYYYPLYQDEALENYLNSFVPTITAQ